MDDMQQSEQLNENSWYQGLTSNHFNNDMLYHASTPHGSLPSQWSASAQSHSQLIPAYEFPTGSVNPQRLLHTGHDLYPLQPAPEIVPSSCQEEENPLPDNRYMQHSMSYHLPSVPYDSVEDPMRMNISLVTEERMNLDGHLGDDDDPPAEDPYNVLLYRCLMSVPPHYEMQLKDIYAWFRENTGKRSAPNETGWKNSIRHNLSMNPAFHKGSRSDPENGRKNMWSLTDEAISNGIEPTTRFRRNDRQSYRTRSGYYGAAPQRQASGARGGRAARQSARRNLPRSARRLREGMMYDSSMSPSRPLTAPCTPMLGVTHHGSPALSTPSSADFYAPLDGSLSAPYYLSSTASTPLLGPCSLPSGPASHPPLFPCRSAPQTTQQNASADAFDYHVGEGNDHFNGGDPVQPAPVNCFASSSASAQPPALLASGPGMGRNAQTQQASSPAIEHIPINHEVYGVTPARPGEPFFYSSDEEDIGPKTPPSHFEGNDGFGGSSGSWDAFFSYQGAGS